VSKTAQGLGVGKKLLHVFEEAMKADGCRILLIDTQSDNVAARSFFGRAGFKNFEDHRYYTKVLPRAEEEEEAAAAAVAARSQDDVTLAAPSASRQGIPQPRLMRLTTSKKAKVMDS
jgi:N-acetylglutamate synthase-like GNAT family acetyltransferase